MNPLVSTFDIPENSIQVYPNPAIDRVYIEQETEKLVTVKVFDHLGKQIMSARKTEAAFEMDLSDLPSGMYTVQLEYKEGRITKPIILQ